MFPLVLRKYCGSPGTLSLSVQCLSLGSREPSNGCTVVDLVAAVEVVVGVVVGGAGKSSRDMGWCGAVDVWIVSKSSARFEAWMEGEGEGVRCPFDFDFDQPSEAEGRKGARTTLEDRTQKGDLEGRSNKYALAARPKCDAVSRLPLWFGLWLSVYWNFLSLVIDVAVGRGDLAAVGDSDTSLSSASRVTFILAVAQLQHKCVTWPGYEVWTSGNTV